MTKALESIHNPDVTIPRLDTGDAVHYGNSLPDIAAGFVAAGKECLNAFLCTESVLDWKLGGDQSLILMTRILAFLAPLCLDGDLRTQFEGLSIRFHYFVTLILICRRSFLNVKLLIDGTLGRVSLPPSPLNTMLDQWETTIRSRLSSFFTAMAQDDMASVSAYFTKEGTLVKGIGGNEIFRRVTVLPWYQVPGRGKPWKASITAGMPAFLSAAEWLKQANLSSASIRQVCEVGLAVVMVGLAHAQIPRWYETKSWQSMVSMISEDFSGTSASGTVNPAIRVDPPAVSNAMAIDPPLANPTSASDTVMAVQAPQPPPSSPPAPLPPAIARFAQSNTPRPTSRPPNSPRSSQSPTSAIDEHPARMRQINARASPLAELHGDAMEVDDAIANIGSAGEADNTQDPEAGPDNNPQELNPARTRKRSARQPVATALGRQTRSTKREFIFLTTGTQILTYPLFSYRKTRSARAA